MVERYSAVSVSSDRTDGFSGAGKKDYADAETAADRLLSCHNLVSGIRLYSEQKLLRKMARELKRLPDAPTDGLPARACEYLLDRYVQSVCDSARLVGLRRRIFSLYLRGLSPTEIAALVGVSRQLVATSILAARRQVRMRPDKYAGLHQVYWQEVHRHIYRKPRGRW